MDNTPTTTTAEEAMVVENETAGGVEVTAEQLMNNLNNAEADAPEAEEQEAEQTEQTEEAANPYAEGLQTLYDDGWEQDSIAALITDPQALRDMRDGKTVRQAAFAFMRRMQAASAKPAAKKSVPTFRTAATAGAKDTNKIDDMSSTEFAEFSKRAKEALMQGKLVTFK